MGGSRRDVAAVVVALAAAAVVLAVSELPRCHGVDLEKKVHYLCGEINKGGMACNVELKVNEILRVDCSKAYNMVMPFDLFNSNSHSVCVTDNPLKEVELFCKSEGWTTANANNVAEWKKGENRPGEQYNFTIKNRNKDPPEDMKRIGFGCSGGKDAWAVFNITFSKEVNKDKVPDTPKKPWTESASWGLMSPQRLVFASAMMTIALAVGLSV